MNFDSNFKYSYTTINHNSNQTSPHPIIYRGNATTSRTMDISQNSSSFLIYNVSWNGAIELKWIAIW